MKKHVYQLAGSLTKSSNSENSKRSLENSRRPPLIIPTLSGFSCSMEIVEMMYAQTQINREWKIENPSWRHVNFVYLSLYTR